MRWFYLIVFLFSFTVHGQLDPMFFGTYKDNLGKEVYSIYTMDEVAEDCFLVDYQQFENGELVRSSSGYGHCDGPNGHMEIKLIDEDADQEVAFQISAQGLKSMIKYDQNGETKTFSPTKSVEERLRDHEREMYFQRTDGTELTFRFNEDFGSYTFSIYQPAEGTCKGGEYSGKLKPLNEELTQFVHSPSSACSIRLTLSTEKIEVLEIGAEGLHPNCPSWSGSYLLNH